MRDQFPSSRVTLSDRRKLIGVHSINPDLTFTPCRIFNLNRRFLLNDSSFKKQICGTSLVVQWLGLCFPMWGWFQFLVSEIGSHMPQGQKARSMNGRNSNVTNSMKTFKMIPIKKNLKKKKKKDLKKICTFLSIIFSVEAVEQFFEAGILVRLISTKGSKTK